MATAAFADAQADSGALALGFFCSDDAMRTAIGQRFLRPQAGLMELPKFPGDRMVYNEADLWIAIPTDGVLKFDPELHGSVDDPGFKNWLGFKLYVHRGADAKGNVTITGQRLDAPTKREPTNFLGVEDNYRDMGFLPVSLMVPEASRRELTATAGDSSATWVVDIRIVDDALATPAT